jgi:hypothetical protein
MKTPMIAALAALALATQADAKVLLDFSGTGAQMASPGYLDLGFESGEGVVEFAFTVRGFGTLDGANVFSNDRRMDDVLTLTIDLENVLISSYNLGGGGGNATYEIPTGGDVTVTSPCFGCGGTARVTFALPVLAGAHTLRFAYASETPQGIEDEAWSIEDLTVTGPAVAVPEPATWALLIAGFAGAGAALRRRGRLALQS